LIRCYGLSNPLRILCELVDDKKDRLPNYGRRFFLYMTTIEGKGAGFVPSPKRKRPFKKRISALW